MSDEQVRVWAQDYSTILFATSDRESAKAYFLASGHDWLPIVFDDEFGRWSGRMERIYGGATILDQDVEKFITAWPNILLEES